MKQKVFKIIFTLSVLLNFALCGVVAGHFYGQFSESQWVDIAGEVSPETREIMRATYKEKYKQIWSMREEMREKQAKLRKEIIADKYDKSSFKSAAADVKMQSDKAFESRVMTFSEVLSKLPKAEREKLAQRVVEMLVGQRKWDKSKNIPKPEDLGKNPFSDHHKDDHGHEKSKKDHKEKKEDKD